MFGVDTDLIGMSDSNLKCVGVSLSPNLSEEQAPDSNGDIAAATTFDTYTEASITYNVCAAAATSINLSDSSGSTGYDLRGGKVHGGYVVTGVNANTSNTSKPTIEVSVRSTSVADSEISKYSHGITVLGARKAQLLGLTAIGTGNKLTGSSVSFSCNVDAIPDSNGNTACLDVYGGRVEATNDIVATDSNAPSGTVDTADSWYLISPVSSEQALNYGTGSIGVAKNISKS